MSESPKPHLPAATDERVFVPRARLTVLIDFKSTHACLAKDGLHALEQELGIDGDWLPLHITHPQRRRQDPASEDRGARHRRIRAEYYERDLQRYTRLRGLQVDDVYPDIDTTSSSLGLLWLRDAAASTRRQYVARIFDQYFGLQFGIEDVRSVLASVGADVQDFLRFASHDGLRELNALQSALHASGFTTSPTFLLDGDYFQGRQHLPMLRWLLTDKRDDPPL